MTVDARTDWLDNRTVSDLFANDLLDLDILHGRQGDRGDRANGQPMLAETETRRTEHFTTLYHGRVLLV